MFEYGGDLLSFMKKYGKLQRNSFCSKQISRGKVMEYTGHPWGQTTFFQTKGLQILRRFQKYQLTRTLVANCT
jgi:hypothetical protein